MDNLQVKADAEIGMERDRASEAESKVDRLIAAHKEEMGSVKAELNVLTEETFRLRSAVSNAEKATEKEREKVQNLKSQIDAGPPFVGLDMYLQISFVAYWMSQRSRPR